MPADGIVTLPKTEGQFYVFGSVYELLEWRSFEQIYYAANWILLYKCILTAIDRVRNWDRLHLMSSDKLFQLTCIITNSDVKDEKISYQLHTFVC